ncbi:MAG TPA: hypothetical protein VFJ72_11795 [Rubrobacteraceae bacterium]|nr:hypothetical protein [Rubrobacteraceae bacterium]
MKNILSKAFGIARGTALTLGVAVMLALTFGLASEAFGANGGSLILGKATNVATRVTGVVGKVASGAALLVSNPSGGPALDLRVSAGKAPMKVNSATKVANLNSDKLDGVDSTGFLTSTGKAADADKLDGQDSSKFLPAEIYEKSVTQTIPAGSSDGVTTSCDTGDVAVSGSYAIARAGAYLKVFSEQRVDERFDAETGQVNPGGWHVILDNPDTTASGTLTVYVNCADFPPTRG